MTDEGQELERTFQQWADVAAQLDAIGIKIEYDVEGIITGATFANEEAGRAWADWYARQTA